MALGLIRSKNRIPPVNAQNIPVLDSAHNPPSFTYQHLYSILSTPGNFATGQAPAREPVFAESNEQCAEPHATNMRQEGTTQESQANKILEPNMYDSPAEYRRMKHRLSQREYRLRKEKRDEARTEAYETIIRDLSAANNILGQELEGAKQKAMDALGLNLYFQNVISARDNELEELKKELMKMEEGGASVGQQG